jgi:hypothetical protein
LISDGEQDQSFVEFIDNLVGTPIEEIRPAIDGRKIAHHQPGTIRSDQDEGGQHILSTVKMLITGIGYIPDYPPLGQILSDFREPLFVEGSVVHPQTGGMAVPPYMTDQKTLGVNNEQD